MRYRSTIVLVAALSGEFAASSAFAAEPTAAANKDSPTRDEVEAWLRASDLKVSAPSEGDDQPPQLPPPRRGLVVESALGTLVQTAQLGELSPPAFWLRFALGYEVLRWLMPYVSADVAFATTAKAARPPSPRVVQLFTANAGLRFGGRPLRWLGLFVGAEVGLGRADNDVLAGYGFPNTQKLSPVLGAQLGIEWLLPAPHLGLGVHSTARYYGDALARSTGADTGLGVGAQLALRYAF